MKLGLFASDEVGYEIAKFFNEQNESVSCLVLDSKDTQKLNEKFLKIVSTDEVFYSDELYQKSTLKKMQKMQLDLIILAWWPYILKENLIDIPELGGLNFHPSCLPYNKGKHPYFWSIVEDVPFGVTLHFIDTGIDSGDIVFQKQIARTWEDTGSTLYDRGKLEIVKLFKDSFNDIKNGILKGNKQKSATGSFHLAREIEESSMINLDQEYKAADLLNLIRARSGFPYGASWFTDNGQKYEVRLEIKKVEK